MFIETSDYIIRKLIESDSSSLFNNYKGSTHCSKYLTSIKHTDVVQTRQFINKCLANYQTNSSLSQIFALAEPSTNECIGLLVFVFSEKYAEIHFGLSNKFTGRGIATAVCKEGIIWLKKLGVVEIRTQPHCEHHASIRVLEKCGFKSKGLLIDFAKFPQLGHGNQSCEDMRIKFE